MIGKFNLSRILTLCILVGSIALAIFFTLRHTTHPFSLGLDLAGGAQLTYTADTENVPPAEIDGRMKSLQSVIERRVNALGVSEPKVYTTTTSILTGLTRTHRLVVELPGVSDIDEAIESIGETPYLEFRLLDPDTQTFNSIGLQGGNVKSAEMQFLQGIGGTLTSEPIVVLNFDREGAAIFSDVTRDNVGNLLGIFLDGVPISTPVIQSAIVGGTTQISGNFTIDSATELASNLNFGALPLPISLSETRTVNPTLGTETIESGIAVGVIALIAILLLFLIVYRFAGFIAGLTLLIYVILVLSFIKLIPVVLTAAGLAGFIISIGFAVDANVLIFERIREEARNGMNLATAIERGCKRAQIAIRDANSTSIIIALLLFWFGTSLIKGFAFTFILGVLVSILTAYLFTYVFLRATVFNKKQSVRKWYIK